MVFFLLHAAVLFVLNNSFSLFLISDFSASANHPRRDARARFDDGSAVCFAALCSRQRFAQRNAASSNAAFLGLALGVAVWVKYSFMALIPTLLVVFFFLWAKRRWKIAHFFVICVLSVAVPSVLSIHSFWASNRAHGYNTEKHWVHKGVPPDMTYRDLLSLKANDLQLFRAPEYFKREILRAHQYSYLGLSHMGIFTDTMNLFQELSVPQNIGRVLIPDQKTRSAWKTPVMSASMSLV